MLKPEEIGHAQEVIGRIIANVESVVFGKTESVQLVLIALIADGHILIEDVPGTGKTSLVSALARSLNCNFNRIQFTPDVMPSDITGFSVYNQKTHDFEFRAGGVMSNIVLADEINRASAKTQSALLEAMEERQVTVDTKTYLLPEPFMVLATQNPVEQYGTYPLPEAQVDRFLIKISIGYPGHAQEVRILRRDLEAKAKLSPVASAQDLLMLREVSRKVEVSDDICDYIVEIVEATRAHTEIALGSSPRGGLALIAISRAFALMAGRGYVTPDDVKLLAGYALAHRLQLSHDAKVKGRSEVDVLNSIISSIAVPTTAGE